MKGTIGKLSTKSGTKSDGSQWVMKMLTIDGKKYSTFGKLPGGLSEGDEVEFEFTTNDKGYHNISGEVKLVKKGAPKPHVNGDFRTPDQIMRGQALELAVSVRSEDDKSDVMSLAELWFNWIKTGSTDPFSDAKPPEE